jgi:hypothetical protein
MGMIIMPIMMNDDNMLSVETNTGYTANISNARYMTFGSGTTL